MDIQSYCINCMAEKEAAEICPVCGFDEGELAESPMFLPPRTILNGRYLLGRVLDCSGLDITYLAFDLKFDAKVVIKEYFPQSIANRISGQTAIAINSDEVREGYDYGLDKFLTEARILARLNNHPGIILILDFFSENNTAYMVMECVNGISLREYLDQKSGKVSFETALRLMYPVVDALREIHNAGLLHCDINPDSIYITVDKQAKLLNFGTFRHAMIEYSKSLALILKPGYAPVEQYRRKGVLGPWTDIYSTAATIYRAITGKTLPESLERLDDDEDPLQLPSKLGVTLSAQGEEILLKALALKPRDRFQTADEFQRALFPPIIIADPQNKIQNTEQKLVHLEKLDTEKNDLITVNLGDKFSYAYHSYVSVGFFADYQISNPKVVKFVEKRVIYLHQPEPGMCGGDEAKAELIFRGERSGTAILTIRELFRDEVKAVKKYRIMVKRNWFQLYKLA